MKTAFPVRRPLQKLPALLLVVGFVFQLGACPCGCLDHNAWVQLFHGDLEMGLTAAGSNGVSVASLSGDHDCFGSGRPCYLNNSRAVSLRDGQRTHHGPLLAIQPASGRYQTSNGILAGFHLPDTSALPPGRPILQVYLL